MTKVTTRPNTVLLRAAQEYKRRRIRRHYGERIAVKRGDDKCKRCRIFERGISKRQLLDRCWRSPSHVAAQFDLKEPYDGLRVKAIAYLIDKIGLKDTRTRLPQAQRLINVYWRLHQKPITGTQLLAQVLRLP